MAVFPSQITSEIGFENAIAVTHVKATIEPKVAASAIAVTNTFIADVQTTHKVTSLDVKKHLSESSLQSALAAPVRKRNVLGQVFFRAKL